ncbi:MAG TPA: heme o synthase [Acidimicrobiia bacterium]|nr:heme o synthase [Acidimicrobiia bacterium]
MSAADAGALSPGGSGVSPGKPAARSTGWRARVMAYVGLTKPRIIELLLVTTVPAMVLADRGMPSPWLVLTVLFGGTLAAGGANTINCVCDRDIDEKMKRTHGRPLPLGLVTPEQALRFGIGLEIFAFIWLWATTNLLAATLAVSATAFYVFVYTMWLKRSTAQNIVIGGAAGAVPVLVGWAAVTGRVGLPAWVMFTIIFMWTPPHFWALALKYKDDYAAAGVPMLPVVAGPKAAARQILAYSVVLVGVTLTLCPAAQMGPVYLVAAIVLGARFLQVAGQLNRERSNKAALRLFSYSITYLGLLFAAIALDAVLQQRF